MLAAREAIALLAFVAAGAASVAIMCWAAAATARWDEPGEAGHAPSVSCKYAYLLGRVVEARVYEGSDWERMVVVAVSWKGAVCVRPLADLRTRGRWIHKDLVPERVREVDWNREREREDG